MENFQQTSKRRDYLQPIDLFLLFLYQGSLKAKKAWDKIRNENTKKIYKEKKSKAKKAVATAKGRVYDNLYARLETNEGEKELYRLARQRDRAGKDVQHVRAIKDENGNVMVNSEAVLKRWKGVL